MIIQNDNPLSNHLFNSYFTKEYLKDKARAGKINRHPHPGGKESVCPGLIISLRFIKDSYSFVNQNER